MTVGGVDCNAQVLLNELTCRIPKGLVIPTAGLPVKVRDAEVDRLGRDVLVKVTPSICPLTVGVYRWGRLRCGHSGERQQRQQHCEHHGYSAEHLGRSGPRRWHDPGCDVPRQEENERWEILMRLKPFSYCHCLPLCTLRAQRLISRGRPSSKHRESFVDDALTHPLQRCGGYFPDGRLQTW